MKKAVFTVEEYDGANNAGPKAKVDIDHYLQEEGFEIIHRQFQVHSKVQKLKDYLFTIPNLLRGQSFDELIFQYPTYSSFLMKKLIPKLKSKTKQLFFIIHDVESLRMFDGDDEYWQGERTLFNSADGLIVHNHKMKEWLQEHGVTVPVVELGIFDYDNPQPVNDSRNYQKTVCFAGNLFKSSFLNKIKLTDGQLDIFGSHPAASYQQGVTYKGQFSPEELPAHLTQNFGLVWDGDVLTTCAGKFGNYMRYNDPHKVSLYLSSGLPVIIWSQAALADFIKNNKLGIAIDDLAHLDEVLNAISQEEYTTYRQNAVKIAADLRAGKYVKSAVKRLEEATK